MERHGSHAGYGKRLVKECRAKLGVVLPFKDAEREFLDFLLEKGEIDNGKWNEIEFYIYRHSDAKFSHGICPECDSKH